MSERLLRRFRKGLTSKKLSDKDQKALCEIYEIEKRQIIIDIPYAYFGMSESGKSYYL